MTDQPTEPDEAREYASRLFGQPAPEPEPSDDEAVSFVRALFNQTD